MLERNDLRREITDRFGGDFKIRHIGERTIQLTQGRQGDKIPVSDADISFLQDCVPRIYELYDPVILRNYLNTVQKRFPTLGLEDQMRMAAEKPVNKFIESEYGDSPLEDRKHMAWMINLGTLTVIRAMDELAHVDVQLSFVRDRGVTSDGRRMFSACAVPHEASKMLIAFYDGMGHCMNDKTGNLKRTIEDMRIKLPKLKG